MLDKHMILLNEIQISCLLTKNTPALTPFGKDRMIDWLTSHDIVYKDTAEMLIMMGKVG